MTSLLSGLAPATFAASAARAAASGRVVLSGADYATTVHVRLVVEPGTVGRNTFVATVTDYTSGRTLTGVVSVKLDFSLPSQTTVQPTTISLARIAGGPGARRSHAGLSAYDEVPWRTRRATQSRRPERQRRSPLADQARDVVTPA